MAHTAIQLTANSGDELAGTACEGCKKPWVSGMRMNAMEYEDGSGAGWHCDECVRLWKSQGEQALRRWREESANDK
jgi:hypothetical protein